MATPHSLDGGPHAANGVVKTRRSHRKSRNGCSECKRRHIRCDERRPACTNCTIAERLCAFPPPQPHQNKQANAAAAATTTTTTAHTHSQQQHQQQHHHHHHQQHQHQHQHHPPPTPLLQAHTPQSPATSHLSRHSHHSHSSSEPDPPVSWPACPLELSSTSPEAASSSSSASSILAAAAAVAADNRHRFAPIPTALPHPLPPQTLPSFTESFNHAPYHSPPAPPASLFTAQHLALLHHTSFAMNDCILAKGQIKVVLDIAIRHIVDAPYLIDQILALSALHCAITAQPDEANHPGTIASYRHQATELQTRAVSSFTRITAMLAADDTASCVPRFLFASILSMQVLAETLRLHHPQQPYYQHQTDFGAGSVHSNTSNSNSNSNNNATDFHGFIERLVECIHLHRGILALIRPTWDFLMQSELNPLLRITHDANIAAITLSPGTECLPLHELIHQSTMTTTTTTTTTTDPSHSTDPNNNNNNNSKQPPHNSRSSTSHHHPPPPTPPPLDPLSAEACSAAIRRLQWAFDVHNSLPDRDVPHAPSGFIVTVPAEYVDVLRTLRPEALVILAWLGVLIHRCRHFWTFGDAGANMIRAIAGYLGGQWHEALAWPLKVIETEND